MMHLGLIINRKAFIVKSAYETAKAAARTRDFTATLESQQEQHLRLVTAAIQIS